MRNAKLNAELSISASGRRYLAPNAVALADIVRMRGYDMWHLRVWKTLSG
jgi:hypothetical protein